MTSYLKPVDYLPHRPPMVLLDEVIEITDEYAICHSYVQEDKVLAPFLDQNGNLPSYYVLELFAQSIGVWSGFKAKSKGLDLPPLGMLLGARDLKCSLDYFAPLSKLEIKVNKLLEDDSLASFDGELKINNEIVAQGRVNVIKVTENQIKEFF